MESDQKRAGSPHVGGGRGGEGHSGGHLCHVCGFQYPNQHPSAKLRRSHRKNCGKPPSASGGGGSGDAEVSGEHNAKKLMLGEEGGVGGGEGSGGVGLLGSEKEGVGLVENKGNAGCSSPNGTKVQVVTSECSEDNNCNNIPSETDLVANETDFLVACIGNDEIQAEATPQFSENAPSLEDEHPSELAVSSDLYQGAPKSFLLPEFEVGATFSHKRSIKDLSSFQLSVESACQDNSTDAIVSWLNDLADTEEDSMINTIGEDKPREDISVKASEMDFSSQEKPQTRSVDGSTAYSLEKDPSADSLNEFSKQGIPSDGMECEEKSELILRNLKEHISTIEKPVTLPMDRESCTKIPIGGNDTKSDDLLFEHATGNCHLEAAPNIVISEQKIDSTSVIVDHLTVSDQTNIAEGQPCLFTENVGEKKQNEDGTVDSTSSEITGVHSQDNVVEKKQKEEITADPSSNNINVVYNTNNIEEQHEEVTADPTSPRINVARSVDTIEENKKNEVVTADPTSHEINVVRGTNNVDEKKQNEEVTADPISHEINVVHSTNNVDEKKQNEEVTADPISYEINVVHSTNNFDEKKQNDEVTADPISYEINVVHSTNNFDEKQQNDEVTVDPIYHEITVVHSTDNVDEEKHNEEVTSDPTSHEINVISIPDNAEEKKQNEEIAAAPISYEIKMVQSTSSAEEKKQNEDTTADTTSREINLVPSTGNAEEKKQNDETTADSTSYEINVVSYTDNAEEKKQNEENTADSTYEINVASSTNNVEEKMQKEQTNVDAIYEINAASNTDNVEEKMQNEEFTADATSHEINTAHSTDNVEVKKNEEVTVDPTSQEINVVRSTDDVEECKQNEEITTKEINMVQSTDDQNGNEHNEVIAADVPRLSSDKNHVPLKVLLAETSVETKKKKTSSKDQVLSSKIRVSKDDVLSAKPGSPKAGSDQPDWNSPARLPHNNAEKRSKGRKQPWVPFICCSSVH